MKKRTKAKLFALTAALLYGIQVPVQYPFWAILKLQPQRELGAARTSAFYAAAPFVGVLLSWFVLQEKITWTFLMALLLMIAGTACGISEKHNHMHVHLREVHEHMHSHTDGHHTHTHDYEVTGEHSHMHTHEEIRHDHPHTPDTYHRHTHI